MARSHLTMPRQFSPLRSRLRGRFDRIIRRRSVEIAPEHPGQRGVRAAGQEMLEGDPSSDQPAIPALVAEAVPSDGRDLFELVSDAPDDLLARGVEGEASLEEAARQALTAYLRDDLRRRARALAESGWQSPPGKPMQHREFGPVPCPCHWQRDTLWGVFDRPYLSLHVEGVDGRGNLETGSWGDLQLDRIERIRCHGGAGGEVFRELIEVVTPLARARTPTEYLRGWKRVREEEAGQRWIEDHVPRLMAQGNFPGQDWVPEWALRQVVDHKAVMALLGSQDADTRRAGVHWSKVVAPPSSSRETEPEDAQPRLL